MIKLLIHVPISNRAWALPYFLEGLASQELPSQTTLLFDVNDSQDETLAILRSFAMTQAHFGSVEVREIDVTPVELIDFKWCPKRLARITELRNGALKVLREIDGTHLFSIDSDVILQETDVLAHLLALDKPVVAGVYHTRWGDPLAMELPNVWEFGRFEMTNSFREKLRRPGDYPVGGLGACTLIKREVIDAGVTYDPIYNAPANYGGLEDRSFSLRVAVAGFQLWGCSCKKIKHLERVDQPLRLKR